VNRIEQLVSSWKNNGRIYSHGVSILEEIAPKRIPSILRLTIQIASPKNKQRVGALLAELEREQKTEFEQAAPTQQKPKEFHPTTLPVSDQSPNEIKKVFRKKEEYYSEYRFHKSRYLDLNENDKVHCVLQMMENWERNNACWAVINHFNNTGQVVTLEIRDQKHIRKRIRNLDSYISRDTKAGRMEKVKKWVRERETLENGMI